MTTELQFNLSKEAGDGLPATAEEALARIQLWVNELFGGSHKQCQNYLGIREDANRAYCCLGIACEVTIKNGLPLKVSTTTGSAGGWSFTGTRNRYGASGFSQLLPKEVVDWFGFPPDLISNDDTGDLYVRLDPDNDKYHYIPAANLDAMRNCSGVSLTCASLNDTWKFNFKQIGEVIAVQYGLDYPRPGPDEEVAS